MKRLLLSLFFSHFFILSAQPAPPPDCTIGPAVFTTTGNFPSLGTNPGYNNTSTGCVVWALIYKSTGFSGLTIALESTDDLSGAPDSGAWDVFTGTAQVGSNPMTSTAGGFVVLTTSTSDGTPWIRISVASVTGSGSITAYAYGYRANTFFSGSSGGAISANVNLIQIAGTNVLTGGQAGSLGVGGLGAAGSAPVGNPDYIAGKNDAGNVQPVKLDNNGNTYTMLGCINSVDVVLSGTGYNTVIAAVSMTSVRVCNVVWTSSSGGAPSVNTLTLAFGTCGSSPTEALQVAAVTGYTDQFSGTLIGSSGGAFCAKESTGNSDHISVTYNQF